MYYYSMLNISIDNKVIWYSGGPFHDSVYSPVLLFTYRFFRDVLLLRTMSSRNQSRREIQASRLRRIISRNAITSYDYYN